MTFVFALRSSRFFIPTNSAIPGNQFSPFLSPGPLKHSNPRSFKKNVLYLTKIMLILVFKQLYLHKAKLRLGDTILK